MGQNLNLLGGCSFPHLKATPFPDETDVISNNYMHLFKLSCSNRTELFIFHKTQLTTHNSFHQYKKMLQDLWLTTSKTTNHLCEQYANSVSTHTGNLLL